MVGGMVLLAASGTVAAIKMTQKDAQRIEESSGVPVEEMTEEELVAAMQELGIQSIELDENDQAIIEKETGPAAPPPPPAAPAPAAAPAPQESYLEELEKLADLRDRGVISPEDFEAKKKQLLGL